MSHCWPWTPPRRAHAALDSTAARRQLVRPVPCCLLAHRAMQREIAGHRRRKYPPQRLGEPALGIHLSGVLGLIDTRRASPKGHLNGNRVMDALLKATGDSSGVAESSCDERPSGAPVAILHVPADCAGSLNVARYLAVIRLTAPCSPSARPRHGYPRAGCGMCQVRRGPGGGALRRRLVTVRTRRTAQNGAPTHEIERQGRWKQGGGMVGRYTRGETAGSALRCL